MVNRIILTLIMFMLVDTVLMGVGALLILTLPMLKAHQMTYFVPMIEGAAVISLIASFVIAPMLRAKNEAA
jgi:hypothetical protein